jgi:hypothetical protein
LFHAAFLSSYVLIVNMGRRQAQRWLISLSGSPPVRPFGLCRCFPNNSPKRRLKGPCRASVGIFDKAEAVCSLMAVSLSNPTPWTKKAGDHRPRSSCRFLSSLHSLLINLIPLFMYTPFKGYIH